jgi:deoxyribodipyrimidine photolyase-related protein
MWEDPALYGDRAGSPHGPARLRLNRLRLVYMHVAVHRFVQHLPVPVTHVPVDELWPLTVQQRGARLRNICGNARIFMWDPADHLLSQRLGSGFDILDSPMFLLSLSEIRDYPYTGKTLRHAPFYAFMKNKLGLLKDIPNMDAKNRKPYPSNGPKPPTPYVPTSAARLWEDAQAWVENHPIFSQNPGSAYPEHPLPSDRREALQWLARFIKQRLDQFGAYQDAIVAGEPWMFHSGCSIFLNCGLLTPRDIIDAVNSHTTTITNKEGFLRQLIGWREFARLYYERVPPEIYTKNVFHHPKKTLHKSWYDATTGIPVVDDAIRDAWSTGYLHHIRRLMVVSNWMNLSAVHPDAAFQWMSEFALDAADWVMVFNVYSMGMWADGGHAMRKPYISGSAYIKRMAHASGPWTTEWDGAYKQFTQKHKALLSHTPIALPADPKRRPRT